MSGTKMGSDVSITAPLPGLQRCTLKPRPHWSAANRFLVHMISLRQGICCLTKTKKAWLCRWIRFSYCSKHLILGVRDQLYGKDLKLPEDVTVGLRIHKHAWINAM